MMLENYVSANPGISGSIPKALASKTEWASSTKAGAVGNDLTKNNTTGFTALPGGGRSGVGTFSSIGGYGDWWSSTEFNAYYAWYRNLGNNYDLMSSRYDFGDKSCGLSVRCVRDF